MIIAWRLQGKSCHEDMPEESMERRASVWQRRSGYFVEEVKLSAMEFVGDCSQSQRVILSLSSTFVIPCSQISYPSCLMQEHPSSQAILRCPKKC